MDEVIVAGRKSRPWLTLILSVLVGALFGYAYTAIQPPIYEAGATLSFAWSDPVVDAAFRQESQINLAADGQLMREGPEFSRLLAREIYPHDTAPDEIARRQEMLRNRVSVSQNYRDGMYSVPFDTRSPSIYRQQKAPALCMTVRCGDGNEAETIARAVGKLLTDSFAALIMPRADTSVTSGRFEPALMEKARQEYAERLATYRYFLVSNPPRITAQLAPATIIYPRGNKNMTFCAVIGLLAGLLIVTVRYYRGLRHLPATIPTYGYLWQTGGFTRLHSLSVCIVGGFIIAVGTAAATIATMGINLLPDRMFWRCIAVSSCATLICIAMALVSIFALIFYAGAKHFKLTEDTKEDVK